MASLRGVSRSARALPLSQLVRQAPPACVQQRRSNASAAAAELQELEGNSTLGVPELSPEEKSQFRPWKRAKDRQLNLPGSRYGKPYSTSPSVLEAHCADYSPCLQISISPPQVHPRSLEPNPIPPFLRPDRPRLRSRPLQQPQIKTDLPIDHLLGPDDTHL